MGRKKYNFKVWPDFDTEEEFSSLLEALKAGRIFSIEKSGNNTVFINDEVDDCFRLELTRDQLLSLCDEISEIACSLNDA